MVCRRASECEEISDSYSTSRSCVGFSGEFGATPLLIVEKQNRAHSGGSMACQGAGFSVFADTAGKWNPSTVMNTNTAGNATQIHQAPFFGLGDE